MIKDDLLIQQLREINYPGQVDVTDAVMQQVRQRPILAPSRKTVRWKQISWGIAACVVLFVAINITTLFTKEYNVSQIGNSIVELYDYQDQYGSHEGGYYSVGVIESFYE